MLSLGSLPQLGMQVSNTWPWSLPGLSCVCVCVCLGAQLDRAGLNWKGSDRSKVIASTSPCQALSLAEQLNSSSMASWRKRSPCIQPSTSCPLPAFLDFFFTNSSNKNICIYLLLSNLQNAFTYLSSLKLLGNWDELRPRKIKRPCIEPLLLPRWLW